MATHGDDLPIYDTELHTPIQLAATEQSDGTLVIYDPVRKHPDEFVLSTIFHDTYDKR